jgi:hypothetical protein
MINGGKSHGFGSDAGAKKYLALAIRKALDEHY